MIPFNKPFFIGKELDYIQEAVENGKISGDGSFTNKCQNLLESKYGFEKVLLTTSCTDALEMAAILLNISIGDEVIVPSFTFVSAANAFALRGATIVFADIEPNTLNIDPSQLVPLITEKTKAIVVVHYAGIACKMDEICAITNKLNIPLIEDVALSFDSYYKGIPLGRFGTFATYSFHETKNIICGEGGALAINDPKYIQRAEIIREKGTNRSQFFRGEAAHYEWVDIGSSFLPSEIIAAYLFAQLEKLNTIQQKRIAIWEKYYEKLKKFEDQGRAGVPKVPDYASQNGQLFYLICNTPAERETLRLYLNEKGIKAVFHYLPLHKSSFFKDKQGNKRLPVSEDISERLLRLPIFYPMTDEEQEYIISTVEKFFQSA